eukprot:22454_5
MLKNLNVPAAFPTTKSLSVAPTRCSRWLALACRCSSPSSPQKRLYKLPRSAGWRRCRLLTCLLRSRPTFHRTPVFILV